MKIKPLTLYTSLLVLAGIQHTYASPNFSHPFYFGLSAGGGATTWNGLVPPSNKQNLALTVSTPISVEEGGSVWGAIMGYELSPYFAVEAAYRRFPRANINFDSESFFVFDHPELTAFTSRTEAVSLMGKVMLVVPKTTLRIYSSAGLADVHRHDMLFDQWCGQPTFAIGGNYTFNEHWMVELEGNYIAGYGESEINPSNSFVPFIYSLTFNLAYRFG